MPRDARFWRNATIIAIAHIAIVLALIRWNDEARKPKSQSIVWISGGGPEAAPKSTPARVEPAVETPPAPEPDSPRSQPEEKDATPALAPAKSDIQLPNVTPSLTPAAPPPPKPSPTSVPKASPKPPAKATPKATPKKSIVAKATPKPSPAKKTTSAPPEKKNTEDKRETAKTAPVNPNSAGGETPASSGPGGGVRPSEFSWYGKMLHDRFQSEWIQPTTSVAIGAKMSALVRIRIEKDGRVSKFTIVKPSGNVVVDESVAAVAARVTQVDPLPKGLGGGAYYEVNINFELNPDK
jgi:TonB family protein